MVPKIQQLFVQNFVILRLKRYCVNAVRKYVIQFLLGLIETDYLFVNFIFNAANDVGSEVLVSGNLNRRRKIGV